MQKIKIPSTSVVEPSQRGWRCNCNPRITMRGFNFLPGFLPAAHVQPARRWSAWGGLERLCSCCCCSSGALSDYGAVKTWRTASYSSQIHWKLAPYSAAGATQNKGLVSNRFARKITHPPKFTPRASGQSPNPFKWWIWIYYYSIKSCTNTKSPDFLFRTKIQVIYFLFYAITHIFM